MAVRDHDPITISNFRGLYDRGDQDTVPKDYFRNALNNRYSDKGVMTREGSSLLHIISSVRRMAIYKRVGEAQRLLLLDGSGNLYDSTNLAAPILSVVGMTDFSMESIFNRAYITPHDGVTGLPGSFVYVYNGSGTARKAAGTAPTGFTLTLADSSVSGHVEAGTRAVGVAFLTDSGYITKPGGFQQITNVGGRKLNVGNLPIGGAGTSGRILVATKIITDFNGDFENQTYFFIPDGTINDNATTSLNDTLSFYDADLQDDASYLLDQVAEIPAGCGIKLYNGRMVTWGENANQSIARVSVVGEPESMDEIEGFVSVNPGDAGNGIKNAFEHRGQIIFQKSQRSYVTQDNGENAAFWSVPTAFEASVGTEPHGVAKILDYGNVVEDLIVTAHTTGLRLYNGSFGPTPLTYHVEGVWGRINPAAFKTVEVHIDAIDQVIYAAIPLDSATTPSVVLCGDYKDGLSYDKIKWDLWVFPVVPTTIVVDLDNTTKKTMMKFGSTSGNVYKMDTTVLNDFGTAIAASFRSAYLPDNSTDGMNHYTGVRLRVRGSGNMEILANSLDGAVNATFDSSGGITATIALSTAPGKPIFQGMQLQAERASVRVRVTATNAYYQVSKLSLFVTPTEESR